MFLYFYGTLMSSEISEFPICELTYGLSSYGIHLIVSELVSPGILILISGLPVSVSAHLLLCTSFI